MYASFTGSCSIYIESQSVSIDSRRVQIFSNYISRSCSTAPFFIFTSQTSSQSTTFLTAILNEGTSTNGTIVSECDTSCRSEDCDCRLLTLQTPDERRAIAMTDTGTAVPVRTSRVFRLLRNERCARPRSAGEKNITKNT